MVENGRKCNLGGVSSLRYKTLLFADQNGFVHLFLFDLQR